MNDRPPLPKAENVRRWVEDRYALDTASGVYLRPGAKPLAYSDGDATEDALLAAVQRASDCSVLSDELRAAITDWPTEYHLSAARANLLRHVDIRYGDYVLELGAGCGALTRYLGETGAEVVAVEGSLRRATITRARCRDLSNVVVVCDEIRKIKALHADWVLLVGVLEYANVFGRKAGDGVSTLLSQARKLLAPSGVLLVAIENQLGLKYFNGCGEDHLGAPYFGIADLYRADGPVTLGRRELDTRLADAGFAWREFYLPFPDYKLPSVVLAAQALETPELDLADLVSRASSRDYGGSTLRAFSESLAWAPLARNGLVADHANSFLILAGTATAARRPSSDALAWSYSTARPSRYLITTTIGGAPEALVVKKARLLQEAPAEGGEFTQQISDAPYVQGRLLSREMLRHAERGDIDALLQSALPWLDLLLAAATAAPHDGSAESAAGEDGLALRLPPDYVDLIPGNVLIDESGAATAFDLEWRYRTPVAFEWVLLRGLVLALLGIVNSPLRGTVSIAQLAERLLALRGKRLSPRAAQICEAWETRFYTLAVAGVEPAVPPLPAERLTAPFFGAADGVAPTNEAMAAQLRSEQGERARLEVDCEVLRRMFDTERAGHEASIAQLRDIDAKAHASVATLTDTVNDKAAELHREQAERERLAADGDILRQMLDAERAEHATSLVKLRETDAKAHASVSALAQEIATLRETLAAEQRMHAESIDKLREIDGRCNQATAEVARLYASEVVLVESQREAVELRRKAEDVLDRLRAEYAQVEAELSDREAAREDAVREIGLLQASIEQLRRQRSELEAILETARAELSLARTQMETRAAEYETGRAQAAERITSLQGELAQLAAEGAEVDRKLAATRTQLAATASELALARARNDAQLNELAQLYQERSTAGARFGRMITRQRNRWFPVATARGRAITLANRFVVAVAKQGTLSAMRQTGRFLGVRAPLPASIKERIGANGRSRAQLAAGGTATPPELAKWIAVNEPDPSQLAQQRRAAQALRLRPLISFIVPVHKVPTPILQAALESLEAQTYDNWEACLACVEDDDTENWLLVSEHAERDSRVRPIPLPQNRGISGNSNLALAYAKGEFVALLDHDDALAPSALFAIVMRLNAEPDLDFLYTDKDTIDESGLHRQNALFKPTFSPEMLHSVNYLTHLNVMRRSVLEAIGGWRIETDGAQDWDLFFRFTERSSKIARVPGLHYHWRIISTSTATGIGAKPYALTAQLRCQRDRLERLGWDATAHADEECGFRIAWSAPKEQNIEVIVHANGAAALRNCLDSLRFARLNDVASIRVMAGPACPDYEDTARDFQQVWGTRVSFVQDATAFPHRLTSLASVPGPPIVVIVDARIHYIGPNALEDLARWVGGASSIAWASGVALAPGDIVLEAGRVGCEDGNSAPLFRHVPLRTWGWFGGPLWHRNASAASPIAFALRRQDLASAPYAFQHESLSRWWVRACFAWRGKDRRGLIVPYARAWLDGDFEDAPVDFDERFRQDPYFHPAFCNVSPLRLAS